MTRTEPASAERTETARPKDPRGTAGRIRTAARALFLALVALVGAVTWIRTLRTRRVTSSPG